MLDRSVLRWGGLAGMAGAVVGAIANLMHPRDDLGSAQGVVDMAATSGVWVFDHYLIAWSMALAGFGLYAAGRSFAEEPARSWGRVAVAFLIASLAVGYLVAAIDGVALKNAAEEGGAAALALAYVSEGLFIAMMGSLFGLVPILYGVALSTTRQYPGWLAPLALASGALGLFASSYTYLVGYSEAVTIYVFTLGSLGATVLVFVLGWYLWKGEHAGVATAPVAGSPGITT